jgi:hypothetical protein
MKRIYKYELDIADDQLVRLPAGATVLTVQAQHSIACLWAMVDPDEKEKDERLIRMVGTGHPIDDLMLEFSVNYKYINTIQMAQGNLVFHVFLKQ